MKARDLIALLQKLPANAEVCTWDPGLSEDVVVEQVILVEGHRSPVVVLGMEIDGDLVEGAEVVWTSDDSALRGLVKAQGRWAKARREAV